MSERPVLSGVVVHWGDPSEVLELVDEWPEGPYELVVVDNGPAVTGWEGLGGRARVVRPGRNLGFGGGANAGVEAARGDVVLVLNPDVRVSRDALEELVQGFAANPEAAGLVPRMIGRDGRPQFRWQLRGLPTAAQLLLQALGWPAASEALQEPPEGASVEQPAAAALALRRSDFRAVGGFDPEFFPAWFEDVDLARRLHLRGRPLLYWPRATVRHGLGGTVGQLGYGRFLWTYQRNLVRYLAKHHGFIAAGTARCLLPLGLLLRLVLVPVRKPQRASTRRSAICGLLGALAGAASGWQRPRSWQSGRQGGPRPAEVRTPRPDAGIAQGEATDAGPPPRVSICVVTRNSRDDVAECFGSIAALHHRPLDLVLVDCGSTDGTVEEARRREPMLRTAGVEVRLLPLGENRGFAGGMNAALEASDGDWVLSLNADARPAPDYVDRLLRRAEAHPEHRIGALTGRLTRLPPAPPGTGGPGDPAGGAPVLDACGMRLTRTWRHLDRGSGEVDRGQYAVAERVFGATGAASLFRRTALEDSALDVPAPDGGPPGRAVFDPLFHSFREDAELAFRLRERGWEVVYEPAARAGHRRFNLPERRSAMPAEVNRHSLKNRYLLRIYHQTPRNLLLTLVPTLARDLAALGFVLLRERSSLGAYAWLWRERHTLRDRRRSIQARRTVPSRELDRWFGCEGRPL